MESGDPKLGELIRKYREMLGLSQAELARAVGVSQATIDKIESGQTTLSRFLPRIAARLGIPLKDLDPVIAAHQRRPAERDFRVEEELAARPLPEERVFARIASRPAISTDEAELPVHIGVGADPIDRVRRPPPLANVRGAYGFLIKDPTMEPEFWPGDIALIHPHLPPTPGASYVFRTEDRTRSQLKYLVRVDAGAWHVQQWNPPDGRLKAELTLSRKEWPLCHRVVAKYSRGA